MSLKDAAEYLRAQGRGKDTELVHLTKREVRAMEGLAKAAGGSLTRNPETGLPEAGFLDGLLPTILGTAANFVVPGSGMIVGGLTGAIQNKDNPLMGAALGAAGGYGGGQLAQGLQGVGAGAAQTAAQNAASQQLAQNVAVDSVMGGSGVLTAPSAQTAFMNQAAADATTGFLQQPMYSQAQQGLGALMQPGGGGQFVQGMGGFVPTAKAAGLAAAPLLYEQTMGGEGDSIRKVGSGEKREYDYDAGYTGGEMTGPDVSSERRWFTPQYTRRYAGGGELTLAEGGFIIPADVVSMVGNGSSNAGLEALAQLGAQPIDGPGDGQSDDIPASIDGKRPARLARQEAYLPPEAVRAAGGARKLYKMLDRVRTMAHGKSQQQRPVELREALA